MASLPPPFNVVATYDYKATEPEDLAMSKGDRLCVTELDEEGTWYTGYIVGGEDKVGSFPVNRTEVEGEEREEESEDEEEEESEDEEDDEEEKKNDNSGPIGISEGFTHNLLLAAANTAPSSRATTADSQVVASTDPNPTTTALVTATALNPNDPSDLQDLREMSLNESYVAPVVSGRKAPRKGSVLGIVHGVANGRGAGQGVLEISVGGGGGGGGQEESEEEESEEEESEEEESEEEEEEEEAKEDLQVR